MTSGGRSGARSASSSASSDSAAALSSCVSMVSMSDSRTASETSSRISPSRSALTRFHTSSRSSRPVVERQGLEHVGDVGGMKLVEALLQLGQVLLVQQAFDQRMPRHVLRWTRLSITFWRARSSCTSRRCCWMSSGGYSCSMVMRASTMGRGCLRTRILRARVVRANQLFARDQGMRELPMRAATRAAWARCAGPKCCS